MDSWKGRFTDIAAGLLEEDIFICDETGLFSMHYCTQILQPKEANTLEGKAQKRERLSVLFCASSTGEKLKSVVIGKAQKPRCFKNVDVSQLPVKWEAQNKACMTGAIIAKWITQLD